MSKVAGQGGATAKDGISFSDFLKEKAYETVDTLKASETASAKGVTGENDLVDIVEAVTAAELTLQTVVSVRDRLVSAYQEIMRMPI
jgi:flagellar hook-basal body complex protein FliE